MKKLLTVLVLLGMILSLQVSFIGAQEPDPTDTLEPTTYEVVEGDTAESIAQAFGISVEDLLAANELSSPEEIEVGMILVIPPAAEPTEEATEEPTAEPTEEVTEEPTAEPTEEVTEEPTAEPTEEVTEEPAAQPTEEVVTEEPTAEPTEAATEEATEEPTAAPAEETTEAPPAMRDESSAGVATSGGEVEAAAALPGNFTTKIIALANIDSSAANVVVTLYPSGSGSPFQIGASKPTVPVGGVNIYRDTESDWTSNGKFSGVIESSAEVAAVALVENRTAQTADAYMGFNTPSATLYGPRIFNKHFTWESILYCQNAGTGTATIFADLYKAGQGSPRVTLSASVAANKSVTWDIADNSTVQAAWPGKNGEFGYVRFRSSNNIACVVDNQKMSAPYIQSQYSAVPATFADSELYVPLVFHGHGQSSVNLKGNKWNSGVSIVNINSTSANVQVKYTSGTFVKTCTKTLGPNQNENWFAPEVGTGPDGWSCTPSGPLPWSYPGGPTFGSIKMTSNVDVLAVNNSQIYDGSYGAGYSSIPATPGIAATNRAICPLSFNDGSSSGWLGGVRVVNVGTVPTGNITYKLVKPNVNPSGNSKTITKPSLNQGQGTSAYWPEESTAFANFQGAVFVTATNSSAKIAASSSNQNFSFSAAALYDCMNY